MSGPLSAEESISADAVRLPPQEARTWASRNGTGAEPLREVGIFEPVSPLAGSTLRMVQLSEVSLERSENPVPLELGVERLPRDAELPGRFALVPASALKRIQDCHPFDLVKGHVLDVHPGWRGPRAAQGDG